MTCLFRLYLPSSRLRAVLQTPANGIITDDWLQVRGSGGSIYVAWPEIATTGKPQTDLDPFFPWCARVLEHATGVYLKSAKKFEALAWSSQVNLWWRLMTFSHMVVPFGISSSFTVGKSRLVHYNYRWCRNYDIGQTRSSLRQKKVWLVNLPQRSTLRNDELIRPGEWKIL